jgi:hypothetical protein
MDGGVAAVIPTSGSTGIQFISASGSAADTIPTAGSSIAATSSTPTNLNAAASVSTPTAAGLTAAIPQAPTRASYLPTQDTPAVSALHTADVGKWAGGTLPDHLAGRALG